MKIKDFKSNHKRSRPTGKKSSASANAVKPSPKNIDKEYEKTEGIAELLGAIRSDAPVVLVSGRAGTGKSRFIHYLASIPGGNAQIVTAPTGIAALNVGASTIHSTFALPFGAIDAENLSKRNLGVELRKIKRLIIDEISMVRADVLDGIDARLREARFNSKPFGGVQIIMIGDFLQLPPVVKGDEEVILRELGYATPFAFSAKALQGIPLKVVTLKKVWRQKDPEFISMLGMIRDGRNPKVPVDWINEKCFRKQRENSNPMMLTPTRASAEMYNQKGIETLRQEIRARDGLAPNCTDKEMGGHTFEGTCKGSFTKSKQLPVPEIQQILPGVRVMAVRNGPEGSFVNGSLGTVVSIEYPKDKEDETRVNVLFDGNTKPTKVGAATWEEIKHKWNESTSSIEKGASGSYEQIPLVLGYATTIHKCQGLTLEDVRIDLGRGAFAAGQLYVALSRAKSAEGLSLQRPITERDVRTDRMLTSFLDWAQGNENLDFTAAKVTETTA